jgi:hypothetical protein
MQDLVPAKSNRTKGGGLRPSKRGVEPAFWVPAASYRTKTPFLLRTDSWYLCTYMVSHFLQDQGCKTRPRSCKKSHILILQGLAARPNSTNYALLQLAMKASFFPVLNFCNPQLLYDGINLELGDKESPRLSTFVRVLGSSSLTLTSSQHTPPKTNHDAHPHPLLRWCLQVNRR